MIAIKRTFSGDDLEFFRDVSIELGRFADTMKRIMGKWGWSRVVDAYMAFSYDDFEVVRATSEYVRVRGESFTYLLNGYVTPGVVPLVYTCPRMLYLRLKTYVQYGYIEHPMNVVRMITMGNYIHAYYTQRYGRESPRLIYEDPSGWPKVYGYPDDVRLNEETGRATIVELKLGARSIRKGLLQAVLYAIAYSGMSGIELRDIDIVMISAMPPHVYYTRVDRIVVNEALSVASMVRRVVNAVKGLEPPPAPYPNLRSNRVCARCELRRMCEIEAVLDRIGGGARLGTASRDSDIRSFF